MIIYKDILNGTELFTDAYFTKNKKLNLVDDVVYEIEGAYKTVKLSAADINIGANASAEEEVEQTEEACVTGVDVVLDNRLQSINLDKKSYTTHIKGYMKAIKERLEKDNPDRVDGFVKAAQTYVKKVLGNFKSKGKEEYNYELYIGCPDDGNDEEGMIILLEHRDDVPVLIFFKDGILEEKV